MLILLLQELLLGEENMNRKRLLDRENNSVARLTQAKADCEGIISPHPFLLPLVTSLF